MGAVTGGRSDSHVVDREGQPRALDSAEKGEGRVRLQLQLRYTGCKPGDLESVEGGGASA